MFLTDGGTEKPEELFKKYNPDKRVLYCIVLYCIVLYCIVLYCIVQKCCQFSRIEPVVVRLCDVGIIRDLISITIADVPRAGSRDE
jgi:hypothetical protein